MALSEPLIDPALFEPFFCWCVKLSCKRDGERPNIEANYEYQSRITALRRGEQFIPRDYPSKTSPVKWTKKEENQIEELEKPQIAIAVILFKLLPSAHFSLLVYLLGFFTELPICPDNGMTLEESTKKFVERSGTASPYGYNAKRIYRYLVVSTWAWVGMIVKYRVSHRKEIHIQRKCSMLAVSAEKEHLQKRSRHRFEILW